MLTFGYLATEAHLARHGEPVLRETGGIPVRIDAGNLLYDLSLSLDAYLDQAVFGRPRSFSRDEFRALISAARRRTPTRSQWSTSSRDRGAT